MEDAQAVEELSRKKAASGEDTGGKDRKLTTGHGPQGAGAPEGVGHVNPPALLKLQEIDSEFSKYDGNLDSFLGCLFAVEEKRKT